MNLLWHLPCGCAQWVNRPYQEDRHCFRCQIELVPPGDSEYSPFPPGGENCHKLFMRTTAFSAFWRELATRHSGPPGLSDSAVTRRQDCVEYLIWKHCPYSARSKDWGDLSNFTGPRWISDYIVCSTNPGFSHADDIRIRNFCGTAADCEAVRPSKESARTVSLMPIPPVLLVQDEKGFDELRQDCIPKHEWSIIVLQCIRWVAHIAINHWKWVPGLDF